MNWVGIIIFLFVMYKIINPIFVSPYDFLGAIFNGSYDMGAYINSVLYTMFYPGGSTDYVLYTIFNTGGTKGSAMDVIFFIPLMFLGIFIEVLFELVSYVFFIYHLISQ